MKLFILFIISEFQLFFCILRQCSLLYIFLWKNTFENYFILQSELSLSAKLHKYQCKKHTASADLNLTRFMIVKSSGFRPIKDKLCFTVLYTKLRTIWIRVQYCQYVREYILFYVLEIYLSFSNLAWEGSESFLKAVAQNLVNTVFYNLNVKIIIQKYLVNNNNPHSFANMKFG